MIRDAKPTDATQLSELATSLVRTFLPNNADSMPQWLTESLLPEAFLGRLSDPDYCHFVVLYEDAVVGYIAFKGRQHLYHLFISAKYQRQGFARLLWKFALSELKLAYCTVRSSLSAIPVYQRFGFEKSGPLSIKGGIAYQTMERRVE